MAEAASMDMDFRLMSQVAVSIVILLHTKVEW